MIMNSSFMHRTISILIVSLFSLLLLLSADDYALAFRPSPKAAARHKIPSHGTVVRNLPHGYRTVWIDKLKYFHHNGVFYRRGSSGYIVIAAPIDKLDQESNSHIDQDEYEKASFRGFHRRQGGFELDRTAFKRCMADSLGAAFKGKPTWKDLILFDNNHDDLIDWDDFLAYQETRATERLSEIDVNGDGMLDEDEFDAFIEQIQERREARKNCIIEQLEINVDQQIIEENELVMIEKDVGR